MSTYTIDGTVLWLACLQCGEMAVPVIGSSDWLDVDVARIERAIAEARALDPRCHRCAEMLENGARLDRLPDRRT